MNSFQCTVKYNEPIAPYVAYKIGGPADILVFPEVEEDLLEISRFSKEKNLPITMIGTGTNLLVRDGGIRGITVSFQKAFKKIEILKQEDEKFYIRVGAGVEKPLLLSWAIENELTGLEFSSGVPGTIGGGIFMNAGTKYGCYGDILTKLKLYDFEKGFQTLERSQMHFGYREQNAVNNSIVVDAEFVLLKGHGPTIKQEVERIIIERKEKQPLDFPSCGSTFKNPEGHSAGRLIEKSELKGLCIGGAEISTKHANFILNKNNAKAKDILQLIDIIKATVLEKFNVPLECEVIILGEDE
jgi:UDP-N-acetylmuramate dehydrogenase